MNKKPIVNALAATLYIVGVVLIMNLMAKQGDDKINKIVGPIAFLSLFTLSTAVMGYLFAFQPIQLYLDGKKKEGANLFLQTLAAFAVLTVLAFLAVGLQVFR